MRSASGLAYRKYRRTQNGLTAGATYWLVAQNIAADSLDQWYYSGQLNAIGRVAQNFDGGGWGLTLNGQQATLAAFEVLGRPVEGAPACSWGSLDWPASLAAPGESTKTAWKKIASNSNESHCLCNSRRLLEDDGYRWTRPDPPLRIS
jgi:hypothetical protein